MEFQKIQLQSNNNNMIASMERGQANPRPPPTPPPPTTRRRPSPPPQSRQLKKKRQAHPRRKFGEMCCGCCPLPECFRPCKFALGLFACHGTVMLRSIPQILLACFWGFIVKILYNQHMAITKTNGFSVPGVFWSPLYTVTVFLGACSCVFFFSYFFLVLIQTLETCWACVYVAVGSFSRTHLLT